MKIMLDAGHYANYNRSNVYSKYCEGNMTWQLQNYLKKELEKYGFIVDTTRSNINKDLSVYDRGYKAKGYDLFLSLHSNASDVENVDRVVVIKGYDQPSELAEILAKTISDSMNITSKYQVWTRKNSKGGEYYGVLRGAKVANVANRFILEHGFHTNTKTAKWLYIDENLQKLAIAEAEVIANFFGKTKQEKIEDKKAYNREVRVTNCSTLNVRENRPNVLGELAPIKFQLKKGDIVRLGYVYEGWGSIYIGNNWGFVNVKYLEFV